MLESLDRLAADPAIRADAKRKHTPFEDGYFCDVRDSLSWLLDPQYVAGVHSINVVSI